MSDHKLLILVTRMMGHDEWKEVWDFPAEHLMAFIRHDDLKTVEAADLAQLETNQYLEVDVWVINGRKYKLKEGPVVDAVLDRIDWKTQNVTIRIHQGGATFEQSEKFRKDIEAIPHQNTKELLKGAGSYSIGNKNAPDHPFVRFASGLRGNISASEYQERLEAITAQTSLYMRIANTIHHLSYVLHPLDIDFQGLQETNFQLDYWKEIVEDCKKAKALERLEQVRHLIYSQADGADETAESVMIEAEQRFGPGAWISSWEELSRDLPPTRGPADIEAILTALDAGSIEQVKTHFAENKNPIHDWVTKINKSLGEMRDALFARERGLET